MNEGHNTHCEVHAIVFAYFNNGMLRRTTVATNFSSTVHGKYSTSNALIDPYSALRGSCQPVHYCCFGHSFNHSFIHFIPDISIAPLQIHYYSEALPTTAMILRWSLHAEALP